MPTSSKNIPPSPGWWVKATSNVRIYTPRNQVYPQPSDLGEAKDNRTGRLSRKGSNLRTGIICLQAQSAGLALWKPRVHQPLTIITRPGIWPRQGSSSLAGRTQPHKSPTQHNARNTTACSANLWTLSTLRPSNAALWAHLGAVRYALGPWNNIPGLPDRFPCPLLRFQDRIFLMGAVPGRIPPFCA